MSSLPLVEINRYKFSKADINVIRENSYAENNWPVVYVLSNERKQTAYIGETVNTVARMGAHLKNNEKSQLTAVHLLSSSKFTKSATLDIESNLIKYMAADQQFKLINGNLGLTEHNYYKRAELRADIFPEVWNKLMAEGLVKHSIQHLDNSDLFKYSPYKSLSYDQRQGLIAILEGLLNNSAKNLIIEGGAGTGKSVLAIFLFKLMQAEDSQFNFKEFSADEDEVINLITSLKKKFPSPKMALVVPMSSFRKTVKKAFSNVVGLNAKMVVGPAEIAKQKFDIILVDESHRLRKRKNLGAYYGAFDKACEKLGLDKDKCSEVDWVKLQSKKAVFFYDENQSIKPSDANELDFHILKTAEDSLVQKLVSQFRVRGGVDYVNFVDSLLNQRLDSNKVFSHKKYDLKLFDSISEMIVEIESKNAEHGLSRLIAGYAWRWVSNKDKSKFDIEIDDKKLRWNSTNQDWINAANSVKEVGCIHTTQGYDLNYTGIIFGHEIGYDKSKDEIIIHKEHYHDRNGKQSIKNDDQLRTYILNIYKTIMLRGIKGTYIYACDKSLKDYLAKHIPLSKNAKQKSLSIIPSKSIPYVNTVPFYDLEVAAGDFSALQQVEQDEWCPVPEHILVNKEMFACKVVGESMNKIIPDGSVCIFRLERGGSRNGKIVLIESTESMDSDFGSHYTVKEYQSKKIETEDGWSHEEILLKPVSNNLDFEPIVLTEENSTDYKVIGEFVCLA